MKVRVKLYAMLADYLPAGAVKNEVDVELPEGTAVSEALASLQMPIEQCHLVLVNGVFIAPSERSARRLAEGDALAVWPPVAGG
ncbi:MAG: MoaD/ThiS family protein [Rhodospirillales bacterium]|nr:MoaD/ThiS family protein [Rhodospirillales bacterium]